MKQRMDLQVQEAPVAGAESQKCISQCGVKETEERSVRRAARLGETPSILIPRTTLFL